MEQGVQYRASAAIIAEQQSAVLQATSCQISLSNDARRLSDSDRRLCQLLSQAGGVSNSDVVSAVADELLVSSIWGSSFLAANPQEHPVLGISHYDNVAWAQLLVGHILFPQFYFRRPARQLLYEMERSLDLPEALVLAEALEESGPTN